MKQDYELILEKLFDYQYVSGQEYPWIYIPKRDKKFKTGLYYASDEESKIPDANGNLCPFFIVRNLWHLQSGTYMNGERINLEKAVHYLTKQRVSVRKLRKRVKRILKEN